MLDAASSAMHPELFRFTLGGWLYAYTSENVWFSSSRVPVNDSLHWPDHPFRSARDDARATNPRHGSSRPAAKPSLAPCIGRASAPCSESAEQLTM
jgi:hypothetical protein